MEKEEAEAREEGHAGPSGHKPRERVMGGRRSHRKTRRRRRRERSRRDEARLVGRDEGGRDKRMRKIQVARKPKEKMKEEEEEEE